MLRVHDAHLMRAVARRYKAVVAPLATFLLVLSVWSAATYSRSVSPFILPPPSEIAVGVWTLVSAEWFPNHLWVTLQETVVGFVLAALTGFLLGALLSYSRLARQVSYPYILGFQVTPKVALTPIFIIWLGFGIESKIAVAFSLSFFPVLINTMVGFDAVSTNSRWLMRSLGASRLQTARMLALPSALPFVFAGLKASVTLALIGAIVAETVTSRAGLGNLLVEFGSSLHIQLVWATTFIVATLGLLLFAIVVLAERRIAWWHR